MTTPPKPPKGYIVLRVGTKLKENDVIYHALYGLITTYFVGYKIEPQDKGRYFRKLKPKRRKK